MALPLLSLSTPCSFAHLPPSLVPFRKARSNAKLAKHITCVLSTETLESTIIRRSANYPQSFGDYDFIQSLESDYTGEMYKGRIEKMKGDVRCLFEKVEQPISLLKLIDTLKRLGLGYHFKKEIKEAFSILSMDDKSMEMEDKLYATALRFRLLRQYGFEVSQDVFNGFKDKKGDFKESLCEDIEGLLSLCEASHLAFEGEIVLEEARAFTSKHLKNLKGKIADQNLKIQVEHALELPLHWRMSRLESRWYIETYVRQVDMNPLVFELAKLDFNMVQAIYQADIKDTLRYEPTRYHPCTSIPIHPSFNACLYLYKAFRALHWRRMALT
ncbi:alpha-terpineol synthase, chloroplastic-like [Tasmannia lanceolata]|uniref:alpha-terpineol synthase, chloroplastic-like n=1 Tax=Tasmannia lanceolata TaxID=3420 RepID=UPI004063A632